MKEALPAEVLPIFVFAYYTGCRKGEILSLRWSQVDLDERIIRLDPGTTKNNEPRVIPLSSDLHDTLLDLKAARDSLYPTCDFVFSREGRPIRNFRKSWDQSCIAAKLTDERGEPTKMFHDLRRTGVRNLIRAGVPERIAMSISGHKTRSVFDRYNIVSEADLKDAMAKLDKHLKQRPKKPRAAKKAHTMRTQRMGRTA